ncbi:MAG: fumarylacetoacetate hydrolase family protein [Desulfomonile tiedjei]|nr:fumarylacetoacetate hydrolase family protein [Desulfomonile tiedjei]
MKKLMILLLSLICSCFLFLDIAPAGDQEVVDAIVEARAAVKEFALPSAKLPDLTADKAYKLQKSLAKAIIAKGDTVSGFKAGLTSEAGQKRFGVSAALLGPLFHSGELGPGAVVDRKDFVRLFIENEVGYVVGQKISQPVKDVESLKKMIKEVFPAVELPDLRFADMQNLKGPDIIVDAVSSAKYIIGPRVPVDKVDASKVDVTLTCDGTVVNHGKAADTLGDQWKALLWLVNGVVEQGWTIDPGQILITGAMGNMIPGKPGKYEGDWGPLGKLSWTVK